MRGRVHACTHAHTHTCNAPNPPKEEEIDEYLGCYVDDENADPDEGEEDDGQERAEMEAAGLRVARAAGRRMRYGVLGGVLFLVFKNQIVEVVNE